MVMMTMGLQVRILDLLSGITVATINHETRIDWLELNTRGSHLLFRDKKRQLHLYDIAKQVLFRECQGRIKNAPVASCPAVACCTWA